MGRPVSLKDYLLRQSVTGLLILKNGRRVYEYYGRENTDKTLWTSRSVAKSVVSVLVGMAIKEGLIGAVDDPVTRYLPELKGSAWNYRATKACFSPSSPIGPHARLLSRA